MSFLRARDLSQMRVICREMVMETMIVGGFRREMSSKRSEYTMFGRRGLGRRVEEKETTQDLQNQRKKEPQGCSLQ